MNTNFDPKTLAEKPTLIQGHCCNCKVDQAGIRVWLCRVTNGVTIEQYNPKSGVWRTVKDGH